MRQSGKVPKMANSTYANRRLDNPGHARLQQSSGWRKRLLAAPHSIGLWARAMSIGGISSPMACAALRLMTKNCCRYRRAAFCFDQTPWMQPYARSMGKVMTRASNYPLGYSDDEALRLARQATLLQDLTEDVFRRAGIVSGMQVLDLGSGVGDVSFLAARMVGPSGSVLGIERNASSVEAASQRAEKLGVRNVRFEAVDLESFDSPHTFDAVIGRFVLLYLPEPAATLRRFRKFLKPRGVIAFQESDMEQASQVPSSELFLRVLSWIIGAFRAAGVEPNMGSKLLTTFLAAGLPRPTMIAATRAESGPGSEVYDYLAQMLRSLLPLVDRVGLATLEEVAIDTLTDRLRQDATLNERVTFLARLVGAWSRQSAT